MTAEQVIYAIDDITIRVYSGELTAEEAVELIWNLLDTDEP